MKKPGQSCIQVTLFLLSLVMFIFVDPLTSQAVMALGESNNNGTGAGADIAVPLCWLIGIVGGSILSTLLYVGWKKYKAEQRKQEQEREKE